MRRSFACGVALAVLLAVALLSSVAPVDAISSGQLGSCDLTPQFLRGGTSGFTWYNGCIGKNPWGNGCDNKPNSNPMPWVTWPQAADVYTIRSGDADPSADTLTYIPGGSLNEIHLRTLNVDRRWIGLLMYATNGTNPATGKQRQIGKWSVLPQSSAGFQVPPNCPSAVTHNGAEVKPMHVRLWFAAPVGSGNLTFRVMIKEGVQGRGSFWFPSKELKLSEGVAPVPQPQNQPAVYETSSTGVKTLITPAVNVPIAPTDTELQVPLLSKLGQSCAEACAASLPATPFCHRKATVDISSSDALLGAIGTQYECALPILAGCPLSGAARVTRTSERSSCYFRSQDAALSCPGWALSASSPIVNQATLFASGAPGTGGANRTSSQWVADVCYTEPTADSQNVCMCTNIKAEQGANPFLAAKIAELNTIVKANTQSNKRSLRTTSSSTSAAAGRTSSVASGLLLALLSAVFGLSSSRVCGSGSKVALLVVAVVALLSLSSSPVSAHNYMRGLHRATEASVTKPCQAKIGNDPHVQIVAGQKFELEWTNGHGNAEGQKKHYFVILPASSYDELKVRNITDVLRAYLDEAPSSALRSSWPDAQMWERQHRSPSLPNNSPGEDMYWEDPKGLNKSDPLYIQTDPVYDEKTHPNPIPVGTKVTVKRVHPSLFEQYGYDRRAVYSNPKWPWIESVDEFMNPYNRDNTAAYDFFSHQGDIARFNFPATKGPGSYIAWYSWSGYGDCVDIDVMPGTTDVVNRYGQSAAALGAKAYSVKIDHCELRNIPFARTPMRLVDRNTKNASQCIADCVALGQNACTGVQVARYKNAAETLQRVVNIPLAPPYNNATAVTLKATWPGDCDSVFECTDKGNKRTSPAQAKAEGWSIGSQAQIDTLNQRNSYSDVSKFPNLQPDDYICFGLKVSRNQDNQVDEDWVLADDTTDPVWYSTCYLTATSGGYLNVPALQPTPIDYMTSERCVSCDWYKQTSAFTQSQVAMWGQGVQAATADKCADCSLLVSNPPAGAEDRAARLSALAGQDRMFVGYNAAEDQAEYDAAVKAAAESQPTNTGGGSSGGDSDAGGDNSGGGSDNGSGAANNGGSSSSSSSSGDSLVFGLGKAPSILVLLAIGIGGLLLGGGVVLAVVKLGAQRRSSNSDLRRMQEAGGFPGTELSPNPAAFARL